MPDKLKAVLGSRKFWATIVGLGFMFLKSARPDFPLDEEQVTQVIYVLMAYTLGTAIESGLENRNADA